MGGLLSLSIPTYFAVDSLLSHKPKMAPAKAAISELDSTDITITPVSTDDVTTLADGSYYVIAVINERNDGGERYEGALYGHCGYSYREIPIAINDDLSIDIDNDLAGVIASIVEFRAPNADTFDIVSMSGYRYLGASLFQTHDDSWYFESTVSRPETPFVFTQNDDQKSFKVSVNGDDGGTPVTAFLHYNDEHEFEFNQSESSNICIYRLPDGFFEEYSWSPKFNAITSTDNADDLLEMWQNLPIYEKENVFNSFFEGDSDGSGSQQASDYTVYDTELASELVALQNKYNLYKTIVGAEYDRPFACKNVDENIVVDNKTGTISGFSSINRLVYSIDYGYGYNSYTGFNINKTGTYSFVFNNDDRLSEDFIGLTVNFYYSVSNYEKALSSEPLTITFSEKRSKGALPQEEPVAAELTYDFNTVTGETHTIEYNFDDRFMLESIPEGYDIAVVTESFYEAYSSILEEETEDTIPLNLVHYYSENQPIEYADDEYGEPTNIYGETTYYILYRLSGDSYSLFSDCCGYKTFTTGFEPSMTYLIKADNYNNYLELKESDRFSQCINDCQAYYDSAYSEITNQIESLEEPVDYEDFLNQMTLADRWYLEASRIMLLYDYYINDYNSSRTMGIVESLNTGLNNLVEDYVPLDREAVDDYVDSNKPVFEETHMLYSTQEDTAKRMVEYFNHLINYYFFTGDLTDAIAILKSYTEDIYECEDYNEIGTYETNFRIEIEDWFIEHAQGEKVNDA